MATPGTPTRSRSNWRRRWRTCRRVSACATPSRLLKSRSRSCEAQRSEHKERNPELILRRASHPGIKIACARARRSHFNSLLEGKLLLANDRFFEIYQSDRRDGHIGVESGELLRAAMVRMPPKSRAALRRLVARAPSGVACSDMLTFDDGKSVSVMTRPRVALPAAMRPREFAARPAPPEGLSPRRNWSAMRSGGTA